MYDKTLELRGLDLHYRLKNLRKLYYYGVLVGVIRKTTCRSRVVTHALFVFPQHVKPSVILMHV